MKVLNYAFLVFIGLCLLSTSKKNINSETLEDPIIGVWELVKIQYNFPDGTNKENKFYRCYDKARSIYRANGTLDHISPKIYNNTGECNFDVESYWKGTWKKIDDNRYSRKKLEDKYADTTEVYFFLNKGNTLKILRNYKDAGIIFNSNDAPISEYVTLNRIE